MKLTKGAIIYRAEFYDHPVEDMETVTIREFEVTTLGQYMAGVTPRKDGKTMARRCESRFRCFASLGSQHGGYFPTPRAAVEALRAGCIAQAQAAERDAAKARGRAEIVKAKLNTMAEEVAHGS